MAHVITPSCVCDASCVPACPVDAIGPSGSFEAVARAGQLFIDPRACIDCGACAAICPVDAIFPADRLPALLRDHAELNRQYFLTAMAGGPGAMALAGGSTLSSVAAPTLPAAEERT